MVCDGSISERTARLRQPYVGRPDDRGIVVTSERELYETLRKAHEADWQLGVHANGDEAIDVVLRIYERLQRERPRRDPRFRLEHCTMVDDELVRRISALGAIPTPFSTYVYWHGEKMKEYGAERLDRMFALRSFLDAGIRAHPGLRLPARPLRADDGAPVRGHAHRLPRPGVGSAAADHGGGGACAWARSTAPTPRSRSGLKGSLEAGKLADLVVLGRDPLREDPSALIRIPVEKTMVGGRWVFEA